MIGSGLILLREGLEGALIVAIVLGYLRKIGAREQFRAIWLGTGLAVLVAATAGVVLFTTVGELEGDARRLTFAIIMATAAGVLTWMIFWMRREARAIKGDLQSKVDRAMVSGSVLGMAAVVFFGVAREGLEASLFFLAAAGQSSTAEALIGGALGLAGSVILGYAVYRGAAWLNLRQFFTVSGLLILLLAGGLLARALAEVQVLGLIPTFWYPVFDATSVPVLDATGFGGELLRGLFGWDPAPSIEELTIWLVYLTVVGALFLRGPIELSWLRRQRPEPSA